MVLSDLCLVLYTSELLLHFFSQGFSILKDWMICIDLGIIICGYIEYLLDTFLASSVVNLGVLRGLRLVRIFRLIRLLRKVRTLRELHKLGTMMATSFCIQDFFHIFAFLLGLSLMILMLEHEDVYFDIRVLKNMQNINARGLGLGHDLFESC